MSKKYADINFQKKFLTEIFGVDKSIVQKYPEYILRLCMGEIWESIEIQHKELFSINSSSM